MLNVGQGSVNTGGTFRDESVQIEISGTSFKESVVNYYMLQRLKGDSPGHPVFFEYTLDRESAGENHRENQFVEFFTGFSGSPLIFLCKHKVLDFDYYDMKAGEYFFSQRLFDAADGLTLPAHAVKAVRFLSRKRTEIAKQDYCVLRIRDLVDAVDPDKSVIEQSQQYEYRKITKHLALDRAALGELDLFRIKDMTMATCLFCSERFRQAAESGGAVLRFVPESEAAEAYAASNPFGPV